MSGDSVLDAVAGVNRRLNARALLELLGCGPGDATDVGGLLVTCCPLHGGTNDLALEVDLGTNSFRCSSIGCPGVIGGNLVELAAWTRGTVAVVAAADLVEELAMELDAPERAALGAALAEEARSALASSDMASAEAAAVRALRLDPDNAEARSALGEALARRGEVKAACDEFLAAADGLAAAGDLARANRILKRAEILCPDLEDIPLARARIAELRGKSDRAAQLLERVAAAREQAGRAADNLGLLKRLAELRPADPSVRLRLAALHEMRRDMRSAIREMEQAVELLTASGQGGEAIPIIEKVLKLEPQRNRMRLALTDRLVEQGEYEQAKQHLFEAVAQQVENSEYVAAAQSVRHWLEIEPESCEAHEWLARIYQEQEMAAESAAELCQAAEICRRNGEGDRALQFYFRAKFVQPDNEALREAIVSMLLERNEGERAVFELMDLAEVRFARGMPDEAREALRRAAEADASAGSRVQVAAALRAHGHSEGARALLVETAEAFEAAGEPGQALVCWDAIAEVEPADTDSRNRRLHLLWQTGDAARAVERASELAHLLVEEGDEPGAVELVRTTAGRLAGRGRDELCGVEAAPVAAMVELCAQAGALDAADELYRSASDALRGGVVTAALACAETMLRLVPGHEPALRDVADLGELAGTPERAAEALADLADQARRRGDKGAAADFLQRAATLAPSQVDWLRLRAQLLEEAGEPERACQGWREFLERVRQARTPAEALAEHEAYLAVHPEDAVAGRSRAELLAQVGRTEDAEAAYGALLASAREKKDLEEELALRAGFLALAPGDPVRRVALAGALVEAGDIPRAAAEFVQAARDLLAEGMWERAALAAGRALDLDPDSADALGALAEAERERGNLEALEPALSRLAERLVALGRSREALPVLDELASFRSSDPEPRRRKAEILDAAGQGELALPLWLETARLHADGGGTRQALDLYSRIEFRIAGDAEALESWARLAETSGEAADREAALVALADFHLAEGGFEAARAALRRLRASDPASLALATALRRLAEAQGPGAQSVDDWIAAFEVFSAAGEPASAGACLNRAVDADPTNPQLLERLIRFYEEQNDPESAFRVRVALLRTRMLPGGGDQWRADLEALRGREDLDAGGRLAVARALLESGRRDEALPDLEQAAGEASAASDYVLALDVCEADPCVAALSPVLRRIKADALIALGRIEAAAAWLRECAAEALKEGHPDEAEAYTKRCSTLIPADPAVLGLMTDIHLVRQKPHLAYETSLAQANFLWARGDYDGAAEALRRAIETAPDSIDARRFLWQVELDAGRQAQALEEMQQLVDLLLKQMREREAYELLRQMLRLEPRAIAPLRAMAALIYRHRGFPKALPAYRRLLSALRDQGLVDEALREYESVLDLEDAPVELRLEYADYLDLLERHREAKRQYLLAGRYVRDVLGDYGHASRLLAQAATEPLEPEDAEALEELGVLRRIARMGAQAAQAFREAARLHETRGYHERALECLQQAMELVPGATRPGDLADMARLLLATGRRREAIEACRRAIRAVAHQAEEGEDEEAVTRDQLLAMRRQLFDLEPLDTENALALIELLPQEEAVSFALEVGRQFQAAGFAGEQVRLVNATLVLMPENLALRAEAVAVLRRQNAPEALRAALAELCRTAARLGDAEIARAALEQVTSMPRTEGAALMAAPLHALCGDTARAIRSWCEAAREFLDDDDPGGAAGALDAALSLSPDDVPASLIARLVRRGSGSTTARSVALRAFDDALVRRLHARSAVVGAALLETLPRPEAAVLVRHMTERGGAALASLVAGVCADRLLRRGEAVAAGTLVRQLTDAAAESPDAWKLASRVLGQIGESEAAEAADARAATLVVHDTPAPEEGELSETDEDDGGDEEVLETLASFYEREHRIGDAVRAMRRLSDMAEERGDSAASAQWLKRALSVAPADSGLRELLAERLVEAQRHDEAAEQFRELAQYHMRQSDTEGARTAAEHVLDLDPGDERMAEFLLQLADAAGDEEGIIRETVAVARARIRAGAPDRAYQLLMTTLERFPNHPDLLRALAACTKEVTLAGYHTNGDIQTGGESGGGSAVPELRSPIAQFEMLLSLQPDDLDVIEILVNTCAAEGLEEKHARYAEELVRQASARGDLERAVESAHSILNRAPTLASVRRALGDALHAHGRSGEAVPEWLKAAELYAAQGKPGLAVECARQVTDTEPDNFRAWRALADYLAQAGDTEGARTALEKVTESFRTPSEIRYADTTIRRLKGLQSGDPVAHERAYVLERRAGRKGSAMEELVWLVRYHLSQGNLEAAEKMIREGEELDPDSLSLLECRAEFEGQRRNPFGQREALLTLARRAAQIGDRPRVREAIGLIRSVGAGGDTFQERVELGDILFEIGDREEAFAEFAAAVKAELSSGDPSVARAAAETILKRHPGHADLYGALAALFVPAGRADIAAGYFTAAATLAASVGDAPSRERYLREALALRPKWGEGLLQLGESYVLTGDRAGAMEAFARLEAVMIEEGYFDKAADAVRRQLSLHPKDMALRERLAGHYERAGHLLRAAETMEELAEMRYRKGDIKGALAACRKLMSLRPGESSVLQRYAELLNRLGDGPEVVEAYLKLADIYYNRGANTQAGEIYARVLGIDPENTEARKRLMRLQR